MSARPRDLRALAAIEDAGLALFLDWFGPGVQEGPLAGPAPDGRDRALVGRLLVAVTPTDDVVGFAHVVPGDPDDAGDSAHLEQLSVHPAAGRRGVGARLLAAVHEEARWDGVRHLTLCTFRDVPWNAPFYRRHGYAEVPEPQGALARRRDHERRIGLDDVGARVAMDRLLARA